MIRDRIIALGVGISRTVTLPWTLGVFRTTESSPLDEITSTVRSGLRPVIIGDFADAETRELLRNAIDTARAIDPQIPIAILLHWTQALMCRPDPGLLNSINATFVAVDKSISKSELELISQTVAP